MYTPRALRKLDTNHRCRILEVVSVALLLGLLATPSMAEDDPAVWQALADADQRVRACRAEWARLVTIPPRQRIDPEHNAAQAKARAVKEGLSPELQAAEAKLARQRAESEREGFLVRSTVALI